MIAPAPAAWLPYCGAAPVPAEVAGRWNFDPVLILALGLAVFAWRALARGDARTPRPGLAMGALGFAILLFVSPFCAVTSALFSARVVHHVLLTAAMAPLLVLSLDRARFALPGGVAGWTAAHALIFWAWHSPDIYARALASDGVYWLMQASLLLSAMAFWAAIRRASPASSVAALLAMMVQMGLLGALITFAARPLYAPHFQSTLAWGLSALEDQQAAGLIMWAPSAAFYLAAALVIAARWLRDEDRPRADAA